MEGGLRTLPLVRWVAIVVILVVIVCFSSTDGGRAPYTAARQLGGSRSRVSVFVVVKIEGGLRTLPLLMLVAVVVMLMAIVCL